MNPTPAQLTYIAAMLYQLRIELADALRFSGARPEVDSLWMLRTPEALSLMHVLEHEKRNRGFPQRHLD